MTYYTHAGGLPLPQTRALASQVAAELDLVAASFALLPTAAQLSGGSANYAVDTGAVNALAIAISSNVVSLTDGLSFLIRAVNTNTGASTLAPGALGATALVRADGTALQAGDIVSGQIIEVAYSSAMAKFQLLASGAAVSATAAAASAALAQGYAASATNAANVAGTSTSSVAIPSSFGGSISFTYVEASRTPSLGMYIISADTAAPSTNSVTLQVTAFDSGTKVVTGTVVAIQGSGTKSAWTLSLTGAPGAGVWIDYTPTITSSGGSITTVGAKAAQYKVEYNRVTLEFDFTITTNGTGSATVVMTLPFPVAVTGSGQSFTGTAREVAISGALCSVTAFGGDSTALITNYANAYPAADGARIIGRIVYRK